MKIIMLLLLIAMFTSGCNEEPVDKLTAGQIVQNRLNTKQQAANAPAAVFNQHVRETPILSPLVLAGEMYAQQMQKMTPYIERSLQESWGTELSSRQVNFDGQVITYQYQLWTVKSPAVCSHIKHEITEFSACTIAAKKYFQMICNKLQPEHRQNFRVGKFKNMYCRAAVEFKPTIAQISRPKELSKEKQILRQKCNDAIVNAMISGSADDKNKRKKACIKF